MARLRVQGGDVRLEALFPEVFSAVERSKAFAEFAREQIGYAQQVNASVLGGTPKYKTYVDRREGAPLESVRPDGEIVAEWDLLTPVLDFIREQLVKHSPVGKAGDGRPGHPGMYRASHILIVDGKAHEDGAPLPALFEEAVFSNTTPYSRKIEGSEMSGRRPSSSQAPDGVYDAVALLAQSRFGNIARIGFGWRSLLTGGIHEWAQTPSAKAHADRHGRKNDVEEWLRRQPSVIIRPY